MPDEPNTDPNDTAQATIVPDPPSANGGDPPAQSGDEASDANLGTITPPAKADETPIDPQKTRNAFIAKLTDVDDSSAEAPAKDTPAPADPSADPPADAKQKTPVPVAAAAAPPADGAADPDLVEMTNESAAKLKPGEVRRKMNKLLTRYKEGEPFMKVGREIIDTCEKAGFDAADYRKWMQLGIGMQTQDPEAVKAFGDLVTSMGYLAPDQVPQPVAPPDPNPAIVAWLAEREREAEITPDAARTLRAMLAGSPAAAPAAAQPPVARPVTPPARQPQPQQHQPAPQANPMVALQQRAVEKINQVFGEYETRHGKNVITELEPRITAALAKRKGAHPDAWPDIVRAVIDAELAKAHKQAPVQPVVRPGTGTAPAVRQFGSAREHVIHSWTGG